MLVCRDLARLTCDNMELTWTDPESREGEYEIQLCDWNLRISHEWMWSCAVSVVGVPMNTVP